MGRKMFILRRHNIMAKMIVPLVWSGKKKKRGRNIEWRKIRKAEIKM